IKKSRTKQIAEKKKTENPANQDEKNEGKLDEIRHQVLQSQGGKGSPLGLYMVVGLPLVLLILRTRLQNLET
ncbi:hypothetical protein C7A09_28010, partial [Pseudomonas fluorescens]